MDPRLHPPDLEQQQQKPYNDHNIETLTPDEHLDASLLRTQHYMQHQGIVQNQIITTFQPEHHGVLDIQQKADYSAVSQQCPSAAHPSMQAHGGVDVSAQYVTEISQGEMEIPVPSSSIITVPPPITLTRFSCNSSTFGSVFKRKQHRRRSSSVVGWDSDDDGELDRATAQAGTILAFTFKEQILHRVVSQPSSRSRKGGARGGEEDGNGGLAGETHQQRERSIESKFHVNKTITLDPRLHKVFYGIDYTPQGSQEPDCKVDLGHVIEDIKILSQLTNRIRLYGMACHQSDIALMAIEYLELPDMQIILTLWVDHNKESWEKQARAFWSLIDRDLAISTSDIHSPVSGEQVRAAVADGPTGLFKASSRIIGISVGNEVLFRNEGQSMGKLHVAVSVLVGYMSEIRRGLAERANYAAASADPTVVALARQLGEIPIFSSDLGRNAYQIVDHVDWVMSNIHPFFAYTSADQAAGWAFSNFMEETVQAAAGKPAAISEIGWPSGPSSANLGSAVPSIENLQMFLDRWLCQANKRNIPYYYFEAFDEPWKASIDTRESQWGLLTVDRRLKVSIPTC
ncbi:hypothetical protein BG011_004635 [Mortierella polycephala]|uniref:glucan endo-1,3-beta-D-glucosidase n=1 Tax=Mortierella polycephala TaxID=41804 RepID=A0A9P6Q008_9FUNG|nr:hypothetical protein BG011_004635 [Mortierella polycephala]